MSFKNILRFSLLMVMAWQIKTSNATDFYQNFSDSTLRIDYILAGGPDGANIFIDSSCKQKGWAGRKSRLKETPAKGNGTIIVADPISGDTLYMNTFSTLFQEWLVTPEASSAHRAFENPLLIPLPIREADIKLELRDSRHQPLATNSYRYRPDDELVAIVGQNPLPHMYLHNESANNDVIDIAILAEGYRAEEMDTFINRAKSFTNEILSYEPFASNRDKFRFVAVMSPSKESGVSIPIKKEWKNTAFDSHYSTFYSARYLTVPRVKRMHQALEGVPYEHILVVVNTPQYGGGGIFNSYQVAAADNPLTLPVTVHEFGHSFAGLADEYFYEEEEDETYPLDTEPWEKNITTLSDFKGKWENMISPDTPVPTPWNKDENYSSEILKAGLYEGGGYKPKGIYRPYVTCRMRDNVYPTFCGVCENAISEIISFYTAP